MKGQANITATVLIILLVVAAAFIMAIAVQPFLSERLNNLGDFSNFRSMTGGETNCTTTVSSSSALNSAVISASPGDVICLQDGNYGSFTFTSSHAKSNWITIRGNNRDNVKFDSIFFNPSGTTNFYIKIDSISVEVPSPSTINYGVQIGKRIGGTLTNVQILNSKIYGEGYGEFYPAVGFMFIVEASDILIQDNEIYNGGSVSYGIQMQNNFGEIILKNNKIVNITRSTIALGGGNTGDYSYLIEGNYLMQAPYEWCSDTTHCGGSGISIRQGNVHVKGNTIVGGWGTSPLRTYQESYPFNGYSDVLIENNIVSPEPNMYKIGNPKGGGNFDAQFIDAGNNYIIMNNVFAGGMKIFFARDVDGSGIILRNNIASYFRLTNYGGTGYGPEIFARIKAQTLAEARSKWDDVDEGENIIRWDLTSIGCNYLCTYDEVSSTSNSEINVGNSFYNDLFINPFSPDYNYNPLLDGNLCNGYFSWAGNGTAAAGALPCGGEVPQPPPTCAEQNASICSETQTCSGNILNAPDTDSCCDVACTEAMPTCSEQNGSICLEAQPCPGNILNASNTDKCCDIECTKCVDTDGGNKIYTKGIRTSYFEGYLDYNKPQTDYCKQGDPQGIYIHHRVYEVDSCSGSDCGIIEFYCNFNYPNVAHQGRLCSYGCFDGACCEQGDDSCRNPVSFPEDYISWWKFDNDFNDSKDGNDGTCTSCPNFVNDRNANPNGAGDFSSDLVNFGSNSNIDNIFAGGGTVSAWIYIDSYGASNMAYVLDKYENTVGDWIFWIRNEAGDNSIQLSRDFSITNGYWIVRNALSTGQWIHIAVTYDEGSTANVPIFYIDGSPVSITESVTPSGTAGPDTAVNLYAGGRVTDSNRNFDGKIDDVLIYDRILSAQEIQDIYNKI